MDSRIEGMSNALYMKVQSKSNLIKIYLEALSLPTLQAVAVVSLKEGVSSKLYKLMSDIESDLEKFDLLISLADGE